MLNMRYVLPDHIIDLNKIEALSYLRENNGVLEVGAMTRQRDLEFSDVVKARFPLIHEAILNVGHRQTRNRGTIGGSLAHADPAADWVSTMTLLDATLVLQGAGAPRRMKAPVFFEGPFTTALAPEELLVAIEVPRFSGSARWAYRKVCRKPGEFAEAIAAAWIDPARGIARVVLGALDGMPKVIEGEPAVAALRSPAGTERALDAAGVHEPYERQLHAAMLRRALADLDTPE
jgi:carbon-monoxide dehydrogenase medium subunit